MENKQIDINISKLNNEKSDRCNAAKKCGGCQFQGIPYEKQLEEKRQIVKDCVGSIKVLPVLGMEDPLHYRNKVNAAFGRDRKGNVISGVYEEGTHRIVPVEQCMIEDETADAIIGTIRGLLRSFKIKIYDEDSGYGLLRHVMIRRGFTTGEVLVVLVLVSPILPSKNHFVKALRAKHPEITSIVLNVNDRHTSMVLGDRNITLYGKGYIEDELCDNRYRISPNSFYQVNSKQTQVLYEKAIEYAGLTGTEHVIDAYCGIGTIGMTAAAHAKMVTGIELNPAAVKDAIDNAKRNQCKNIRFVGGDAGEYMRKLSASSEAEREKVDVVFMDPPRSGSTEMFMDAVVRLAPAKVVYISCNPRTLGRDLAYFHKHGYHARECQPVDMFPFTDDVESVVLLERTKKYHEAKRKSGIDQSGHQGYSKKLRTVRAASGGGGSKTSKSKPGKRSH